MLQELVGGVQSAADGAQARPSLQKPRLQRRKLGVEVGDGLPDGHTHRVGPGQELGCSVQGLLQALKLLLHLLGSLLAHQLGEIAYSLLGLGCHLGGSRQQGGGLIQLGICHALHRLQGLAHAVKLPGQGFQGLCCLGGAQGLQLLGHSPALLR